MEKQYADISTMFQEADDALYTDFPKTNSTRSSAIEQNRTTLCAILRRNTKKATNICTYAIKLTLSFLFPS